MTSSDLTNKTDLAGSLGLSVGSVDALVGVGLLPEATRSGRSAVWARSDVAPLLDTEMVSRSVPAVAVKASAARCPNRIDEVLGDTREFVGWRAGLGQMDRHQISGVNRWYLGSNLHQFIGDSFIVTTAGFVLAVYTIVDLENIWGYNHFSLEAPDQNMSAAYRGKRLPVSLGSQVQSWGH